MSQKVPLPPPENTAPLRLAPPPPPHLKFLKQLALEHHFKILHLTNRIQSKFDCKLFRCIS